jgi:hypothetical protein
MRKLSNGEVLAWSGWQDGGLAMADWYERGADPQSFPALQADENRWSRLIVATPSGVFIYERLPVRCDVLDPFCAWGAGMDYALGALAMGADARKAVEVACEFSVDCGFGFEAYDLSPQAVDMASASLTWRGSGNHSENFTRFFPTR